MATEYWTIEQVKTQFKVNDEFIEELESEKIIVSIVHPEKQTRVFPTREIEKLRLATMLIMDMGVNVEGVDVILHMRENMLSMQRQMDQILEYIAQEVKNVLKEQGE